MPSDRSLTVLCSPGNARHPCRGRTYTDLCRTAKDAGRPLNPRTRRGVRPRLPPETTTLSWREVRYFEAQSRCFPDILLNLSFIE